MVDSKLHRDTIANLLGALLPVAITLATVPAYLHFIGAERYGVLALASVLLGYFGLFEFGTGEASARYVAAYSESPAKTREAVFWTVFTINAVLGGVAGFVLWATGFYLVNLLHISSQMRSELLPALPWLGIAVPLVTTITVLSGALDGRQQFITSNLLRLVGDCTYQIVPLLVAVFHGPHLAWLLGSAVLARALTMAFLFVGCWRQVPLSGLPSVAVAHLREVLFFGSWATLSGLLYPLLKTLDQVVIGVLRGPVAVTYYSIPYQFSTKLVVVPNSIVRSLFPRLAMRSRKDAIELARRSLTAIIAVTTPLCVLSIIALSPFLRWWLGPGVPHSSNLAGELLVVGAWLTGCIALSGKLLVAQGRPDLVAKVHIAEIIPFSAVLWIAVRVAGIEGAALVWVLRSAAETLLLFWLASLSWRTAKSLLVPGGLLLTSVLCAEVAGEDIRWHATLGILLLLLTGAWALRQIPTMKQRFQVAISSLGNSPRPTAAESASSSMPGSIPRFFRGTAEHERSQ